MKDNIKGYSQRILIPADLIRESHRDQSNKWKKVDLVS